MSAWSIGTDQGARRQEPEPAAAVEQESKRPFGMLGTMRDAEQAEGAAAGAEAGAAAAPAAAPPTAAPPGGGGGGGNGAGGAGGESKGEETLSNAFGKLAKWIPGDVLALYVTAVTVFGGASGSEPSVILLIASVIVAGLFVLGAGFAKTGTFAKQDLPTAGIAAGAFVIWSVSVPFSGWQQIAWVHDHQGEVAFCAAVIALLYCFFAEGISIWLAKKVKTAG